MPHTHLADFFISTHFMKLLFLLWMPVLWLSGISSVFPSSFEGRVTDPSWEPLADASVKLEGEGHTRMKATDGEGRFRFAELSHGTYRVTVSHVGYQPAALSVAVAGQKDLNVVLEPEAVVLQEVTVQEDFRELQRQQESRAMEVAGAEFVRIHSSGSLMQTLSRLPGIQSLNVGSGQSKPLIRGLGFNRVVVAEHGVKHQGQQWGADHALEVDQFALQEVELIKGPASLAYGSDAIGGVVQLRHRNTPPPGTLSAQVHLQGRSSNRLLGTSVALEGRKQRWSFSARVTWLDHADTRVPVDSVDVYSYRVPLYKNRLRNTAGNELNFHVSAGYNGNRVNSRFFISHVQQEAGFFANAHGLEPRRVDTALYDRSDREVLYPLQDASHFKVVNRTLVDRGSMVLVAETGYQRNYREELSQYVNHGYRPPVFPDTLPMPSDLERRFDKHTLSGNIRLKNQFSDRHELTAGLSAEYQDNTIGGISFLMPAFRQWLYGAYLLHEWEVNPGLRVNGGIRYDRGILRTEAYYDWFPTHGEHLQRSAALNREFASLSGMAGINYRTGKAIVRANLGRSFRLPLAKELAANGVNYHHFSYEVGDASLSPETAWQLDVGGEYVTPAWSVRLSPFITWFPNYIYLNPSHLFDFDHGAGNQIFNYKASEVLRLGGEVTITGQPLDNLMLEFAAEYTYSEQLSGEKRGFTIPFSPPASALAGLSYSPAITNAGEVLQELVLMGELRISAPQNRVVPPERKTPGYQTINAGVRGAWNINGTRVKWYFMVNNLFNAHYLEHTSYYRLIGVPEPGRNFNLSLYLPVDIIRSD